MSETTRLADQIRRAFEGEAWHGDSVLEILKGVEAKKAAAHPIPGAHSIWELLLHIAACDDEVLWRIAGNPANLSDEQSFPPVTDTSEAAWRKAVEAVTQKHDQLVKAVAGFPDARLEEQVPGKSQPYYNFYYLFAGVVQHELYHAGQIALLKK